MKIVVVGLWHLGCVTAACCARHFQVTGLDFDSALVADLAAGKPPIAEPGLADLIWEGMSRGALSFSTDASAACADADLLWVTYDTPVDENDATDVEYVFERIAKCLPLLPVGATVLISSQLPVGSCHRLETENQTRDLSFACTPENLRLGKAIEVFSTPERVIAGVRTEADRSKLARLFAPFTERVIFMKVESAEMTKHALNSFLALSISFMNEIASVCERTGADAHEVELGLKSEARIGPGAYLSPGPAFAGGTLARDVETLSALGRALNRELTLIPSIKASNDQHKQWEIRQLREVLGELEGKRVAVLGLTYKPGTDTLRRSSSLELCRRLLAAGCQVSTFDPAVTALPEEFGTIASKNSALEAVAGAEAVVLMTRWPEFRELDWPEMLAAMSRHVLVDGNGFVADRASGIAGIRYFAVGRPG